MKQESVDISEVLEHVESEEVISKLKQKDFFPVCGCSSHSGLFPFILMLFMAGRKWSKLL